MSQIPTDECHSRHLALGRGLASCSKCTPVQLLDEYDSQEIDTIDQKCLDRARESPAIPFSWVYCLCAKLSVKNLAGYLKQSYGADIFSALNFL